MEYRREGAWPGPPKLGGNVGVPPLLEVAGCSSGERLSLCWPSGDGPGFGGEAVSLDFSAEFLPPRAVFVEEEGFSCCSEEAKGLSLPLFSWVGGSLFSSIEGLGDVASLPASFDFSAVGPADGRTGCGAGAGAGFEGVLEGFPALESPSPTVKAEFEGLAGGVKLDSFPRVRAFPSFSSVLAALTALVFFFGPA